MNKIIEAIEKLSKSLIDEFNTTIPGHSIAFNDIPPDNYPESVRKVMQKIYEKYTLRHSISSFKLPKKGNNQDHMAKLDEWRIAQNKKLHSKAANDLCSILNKLNTIKKDFYESTTENGAMALIDIIKEFGEYKQRLLISKRTLKTGIVKLGKTMTPKVNSDRLKSDMQTMLNQGYTYTKTIEEAYNDKHNKDEKGNHIYTIGTLKKMFPKISLK